MSDEDKEEYEKCIKSPWYFATKYLVVNGKPYTTPLDEEEFNKRFNNLKLLKKRIRV